MKHLKEKKRRSRRPFWLLLYPKVTCKPYLHKVQVTSWEFFELQFLMIKTKRHRKVRWPMGFVHASLHSMFFMAL